ncbi:hypothetical protein AUJ46_03415 [Candidatus Peregrinibacteria bacterium CG1_02_54_53]|nr:MAG: hypothetical protein AUJ46_03415 [Candidatus Peregrinibacteria bacterium CG1_02_54_53]
MLFHSKFTIEKERRPVFVHGAPAAAPASGEAGPAVPKTPELTEKQKEIQNQIDAIRQGNPDATQELANFQVQQADEDNSQLQERYKSALISAANAYFAELVLFGDGEDHLATVNEAFAPAGIVFELGADEKLTIGGEAVASGGEKARALTDAEQQMIDEAFSTNPKSKVAAERLMASMTAGSPDLAVAHGFFENFNKKSPQEKQAILTKDPAFQKFLSEIPVGQQEFVKQLRQTIAEATEGESAELSDEEKEDILDGARQELEKFDASKATEIDKNIMLARMQLRGIDTGNPEEIFAKPPVLRAFEGSPMERGFNKIMGLIGYILLSIQKMKDQMKGKTGAEVPAGQPAAGAEAPAPGQDVLRQKMKEEMKTKKGDRLLSDKGAQKTTLEGEITILQTEVDELKDKEDEEDKVAFEHKNGELQKKQQEVAQLTQEITMLQEMKTTAENQKNVLNGGKDALISYLDRPDARVRVPGGMKIYDGLKKMVFIVNDSFELSIANETGGPIDRTALGDLSGAITFRMGTGVDYFAINDQAVLKQPGELQAVFRQLLDGFKTDVKADEPPRPAAPPAAPTVPPVTA